MKDNNTCSTCKASLNEEEQKAPRKTDKGDDICDQCHQDVYESLCPICEDYFFTPNTPENTFIAIPEWVAKECDLEPGIYRALELPFFRNSILYGVDDIFGDAVELVNACSLIAEEQRKEEKLDVANLVCKDCFEKYSDTTIITNHKVKVTTPMMSKHGLVKTDDEGEKLYGVPDIFGNKTWKKLPDLSWGELQDIERFFLNKAPTFKLGLETRFEHNKQPTFFAEKICTTKVALASTKIPGGDAPADIAILGTIDVKGFKQYLDKESIPFKCHIIVKDQASPIKGDSLKLYAGEVLQSKENLFAKVRVTNTQKIDIEFTALDDPIPLPGTLRMVSYNMTICIDKKKTFALPYYNEVLAGNEGMSIGDFYDTYFEATEEGKYTFNGKIIHFTNLTY